MDWISSKKIDTFRTCGYRYHEMYLNKSREKGKWEPNSNYQNLEKNIKKGFEERSKIFRGRIPALEYGLDFTRPDKFNEEAIKYCEEKFNEFFENNKIAKFENRSKPAFSRYDSNYGFFSPVSFTAVLNGVSTAFYVNMSGSVKSAENLPWDTEYIINCWILSRELKDIKGIAFIYPFSGEIFSAEITREHVDAGLSAAQKFLHDLSVSDKKSRRNPFCDWCDFQGECPAWKDYPMTMKKEDRRQLFRLSYSKLDVYKRCPFLFEKIYVKKIAQKPRDFFSVGSTIHSVMEELETMDTPPPMEEIRQLYNKMWLSAGFTSKEDEDRVKEETWVWFKEYLEKIALNPFIKADEIELYFQFPVKGKLVVNGFIDRIDKLENGKYEIIDYKTETSMRTQEDVDEDMQLTAYFWACSKLGYDVEKMSLHFNRFQKNISTTRTPDDIEKFENEILDWYSKIENETEYKPSENKYCDNCDFRPECPIFADK